MEFRRSDRLRSRTFIGLLIAQFLAAFNDQAIHASAMFFAFHKQLMNEAQAISLMPILFYAPWAIFCTLAGYLADRFSKRNSLVFWKFAEIGICAVAMAGFWLGGHGQPHLGPSLVLACVFLMGTHSAFFVPAKYGAMPEILEPQLLSRGNGILESLSFLAVILGTVCGGVLAFTFRDREVWIGGVLLALAVIGALASLLIRKMPAANPTRKFPPYIYGPLGQSLKTLLGARPLALSVVGIAFFTFVVAYMRQTVYMLGESQTPRWNEMKTSLIVGSTAIGIGIGSPLAGWLSGRKIELGLIPLGGIGMVIAALIATLCVHWLPGLVVGIVLIGFWAGFYLVPMYTLLQHRAPASSKGDAVAVSNFINVTGAIVASVLFFGLTSSFQKLGYAPIIPFREGPKVILKEVKFEEGRLVDFKVDGWRRPSSDKQILVASPKIPVELEPDQPLIVRVDHTRYHNTEWIYVRPADELRLPIYDNSGLPSFLFMGAAGITVFCLIVLLLVQPDLLRRATWAVKMIAGPRVRASGTHRVPIVGAAILATNCKNRNDCRYLRSATDRLVTFLRQGDAKKGDDILRHANELLNRGQVAVLMADAITLLPWIHPAGPIFPVSVEHDAGRNEVRVCFGEAVTDIDTVAVAIEQAALADDEFDKIEH